MTIVTVVRHALIWLRRYGLAEAAGTVAALAGAWLAYHMSGNELAAALAANWAEAIAYYGVIVVADLRAVKSASLRDIVAVLRNMLVEFGPAEVLNLTLLRNTTLLAGITLAPSLVVGVLAGKLIADILFYLPTIASYELIRRRTRPHSHSPGSVTNHALADEVAAEAVGP